MVKRTSGGDVATKPESTPLPTISTNVPPSVAPECVMTRVSCRFSSVPLQFPARLRTVTATVLVSECLPSVTVHLTENDPVVLYTCRGICSFDVPPSPKSHVNDNGSPSGSLAPAAENAIGVAACRPVEGDADKAPMVGAR